MRLNDSLIQIIMDYLQENLDYNQSIEYGEVVPKITNYIKEKGYKTSSSEKDIKYALQKIQEFGFIKYDDNSVFELRHIKDITILGHRYLTNYKLF